MVLQLLEYKNKIIMIKINNLKKNYGTVCVCNVPDLIINNGEIIGLVGNNGAGKTTLFRMVLDLILPTSGEVFSKDINVKGKDEWKCYTASYLDEGFLIDYLTPEEYFYFIGNLNRLSKTDVWEFVKTFEEFFNDEILSSNKYIRDLSKGNQNKVGIAAALISNPEVLVLDEPFANLDPTTQIRLKKLVKDLNATKGTTILISSHDLNHVTDVCTRIILLEKGNIIKDLIKNENTLRELETYFTI